MIKHPAYIGKQPQPLTTIAMQIDTLSMSLCKGGDEDKHWIMWFSPYLQATIANYVGDCSICQLHNQHKTIKPAIGHIPQPTSLFKHVYIDFIDMAERMGGKRYCIELTDRFTRWVEALPCNHCNAFSVTKCIVREVIPRFGIPEKLSSDNGSHFVNKIIDAITTQLGIKHSAGLVERANGTIKSKWTKACQETKLTWVTALPLVLMSMRCSINRTTHLTPHEILTGRPMPVRPQIEGPALEQLEDELAAYMKALTSVHQCLYKQVQAANPTPDKPPPIGDNYPRLKTGSTSASSN